jgi:hypothetical protein
MYDKLAAGVFALSLACTQTKENSMTNPLLDVTATCRTNDQCLFEGREMFVDITITNNQDTEVEFPLEYVQKTGPIVKLIDTRTKAETYLKRNLADPGLRSKLTPIQPGKSAHVEWVITSTELQRFGGSDVDLSAEFTVTAEVQVRGKRVDFRGATTRRIVSKKE